MMKATEKECNRKRNEEQRQVAEECRKQRQDRQDEYGMRSREKQGWNVASRGKRGKTTVRPLLFEEREKTGASSGADTRGRKTKGRARATLPRSRILTCS